ncbi:sterol desaturase family protein [Polyangium sp. y55x31]|uniref:sterol desaturase family protein n=1 Tax=Polyangium sp. y55x31 TaxID=3042688 RepID=UPI00248315C1|nr:sterol desaturase family protein [Polyangium sp. y55x31]MDI1476469.1 sterol desaturase family protein [Polyangium sp. y55x31]
MRAPPPALHARRWTIHEIIDAAVLVALTAAGLLHGSPGTWFSSLGVSFAVLVVPVLSGAAIVTWLSRRLGARIQGPRIKPAPMAREAFETARAMYVAACLMAWPLTAWRLGHPTGLVWDLDAHGVSLARVLVQTFLGVMVIDAWLYWKHRLLHTRLLFGFHKSHHVFRDPTAFAGFAVAPVEALLTFWPILFLCMPEAVHWAPLYFALVVGFVNLNFYLHCGVTLSWVEKTLPRIFLNTSAFHNVHHARANTHFGEALYLWDVLCGTRLSGQTAEETAAETAPG